MSKGACSCQGRAIQPVQERTVSSNTIEHKNIASSVPAHYYCNSILVERETPSQLQNEVWRNIPARKTSYSQQARWSCQATWNLTVYLHLDCQALSVRSWFNSKVSTSSMKGFGSVVRPLFILFWTRKSRSPNSFVGNVRRGRCLARSEICSTSQGRPDFVRCNQNLGMHCQKTLLDFALCWNDLQPCYVNCRKSRSQGW